MQAEKLGKTRKQKRLMQTMIRTNKDLWDIKKKLEKNYKDLKYKFKQNEQELRREKKINQALYENIASGLFIVNKDYSIASVNPKAETVTGYTKEELLHSDCFDLLSQEDFLGTGLLLPPPLKNNSQSKLRSRILGKNGQRINVSMHVHTIVDENNRFSQGLILFNPEP